LSKEIVDEQAYEKNQFEKKDEKERYRHFISDSVIVEEDKKK
jgi:hypothetical protein